MADPKGFLKYTRRDNGYRPRDERVKDYKQVERVLPESERRDQAARCMDCGVPFCHWGCPIESKIPEWQDHLYRDNFEMAVSVLQSTNLFPEFTGTVCPAPCEASCVLAINTSAVSIRQNEYAVIDRAYKEGLVVPFVPSVRSGKRVAVIGSGPCGLALAQQLNAMGHSVVVFEQDDRPGGLLRYGIPDFKLEKWVVERRVDVLKKSGIEFRVSCKVGRDVSGKALRDEFDAVALAIGAMKPRDLEVSGRQLGGVHFAMEYLTQQNRVISGDSIDDKDRIYAEGKHVIVIGGGDTGSDCVGTANRQGAASVTQIEVLPKPAERTSDANPNWPNWPMVLRTSSSHEEGCTRLWSMSTKSINAGPDGRVTSIDLVEVTWSAPDSAGRRQMIEVPGSQRTLPAGLIFLAMGFIHPIHEGLVSELGLSLDPRGNVSVSENGMTSVPGVFAAGDAVSGASLVVRAMSSGKRVAQHIDAFLRSGDAASRAPQAAAATR